MKKVFFEGSSMDEFIAELCSKVAEIVSVKKGETTSLNDDLLTRQETADFLSITFPTLQRWSKLEYLKPLFIGSRVYYKKSEILDHLDGNSQLKIV